MLNKTQKADIVKDLQDKFAKKQMALFVSLAGVKVKTLEEARRKLKEEGSELIVVKKTFLSRVLHSFGSDLSLKDIAGPFAIVLDYESQTQALKILTSAKGSSNLSVARALWQETVFEGDTLKEIAALPSLEILRMRLLGLLASPLHSLLVLLNAHPRSLVLILNHYHKQKEGALSTAA